MQYTSLSTFSVISNIPHIPATRVPVNCLHKILEQVAPEWCPWGKQRDDKNVCRITGSYPTGNFGSSRPVPRSQAHESPHRTNSGCFLFKMNIQWVPWDSLITKGEYFCPASCFLHQWLTHNSPPSYVSLPGTTCFTRESHLEFCSW